MAFWKFSTNLLFVTSKCHVATHQQCSSFSKWLNNWVVTVVKHFWLFVQRIRDCKESQTRLNLSVSCGGYSWIETTDIFADMLFCPLHGTLGFMTIYQSINVKFFELPQYFTFRIILCVLSRIPTMVIVFQVKSMMDTRLLNLWALVFLLKQHTHS